jgi:hypothetical protein
MSNDAIARLLIKPAHPGFPGGIPDYKAFSDASQTFLSSYTRLVSSGFSPETVARAMLGAAVNFHEVFDVTPDLPDLLRAIADRLEHGSS